MTKKLITIKNDAEGKQFVKSLCKYFRNTPIGVRVFGRGPVPAGHRQTGWRNPPKSAAERFAIYLIDKPKTRYVKTIVNKWERIPTKWGKTAEATAILHNP